MGCIGSRTSTVDRSGCHENRRWSFNSRPSRPNYDISNYFHSNLHYTYNHLDFDHETDHHQRTNQTGGEIMTINQGLDVLTLDFIVNKLKELDCSIFLTSHDMKVVEKLCKRVAFINKGDIIKIGNQQDLKQIIQSEINIEIEILRNKNELKKILKDQEFVNNIADKNKGLIITLKNRDYYSKLLLILGKFKILKIKELELSLEELFIKLY